MMSRVRKGLWAGLAATVVVSIVDLAASLVQTAIGVSEFWFHSFPALLAALASQTVGLPNEIWLGWMLHFLVGVFILGSIFGAICPRLPTDTPETKGVFFAVGAWLAMMLFVMPLHPGLGFFAIGAGFATTAWMLFTHMIFGIVLGQVYARLVAREKRAARAAAHPQGAAPA